MSTTRGRGARFGTAVAAFLTCFVIGTLSTVLLFGRAWDEWLLAGLLSSTFVGVYAFWATRPARGSTPDR